MVFVVFAIPVSQIFLGPNTIEVLSEINPDMTSMQVTQEMEGGILNQMLNSLLMHLVWGVTLGTVSSLLTRKWGANYRCHVCNIEFSNIKTYEHRQKYVHENPSPNMKKILILGGGYAGIGVLNKIQKTFENDVDVNIELVSESNFFYIHQCYQKWLQVQLNPDILQLQLEDSAREPNFIREKL